jgi:tetratricopeptide (TPR) repeat protein
MLSPEEFKNLLESIEQKIAQNSGAIAKEDLWIASVLAYQQGKFNAAIEYIEKLHRLNPDHVFAYFNQGIICMKVMKKQESIQAFQEFIKRNPRTWWTSVAAEHLRRLKLN